MKLLLLAPIAGIVLISSFSCDDKSNVVTSNETSSLRYVALGDSYTICEGATTEESWPLIVVKNLSVKNIPLQLIANPSRTGWTTQNLIDRELSVFDRSNADVVTILIGVNDWVQQVDKTTFTKNLKQIIDHVQSGLKDHNKVLLITIPDFGVTPTGAMYSGGRDISAGITEFNDVIKAEAAERSLPVVDIFPISKEMGNDATLVAADGLHPSAKEYAIWEAMIEPVMENMLKN